MTSLLMLAPLKLVWELARLGRPDPRVSKDEMELRAGVCWVEWDAVVEFDALVEMEERECCEDRWTRP